MFNKPKAISSTLRRRQSDVYPHSGIFYLLFILGVVSLISLHALGVASRSIASDTVTEIKCLKKSDMQQQRAIFSIGFKMKLGIEGWQRFKEDDQIVCFEKP